jgi:hypothetical protein
MLKMLSKQNRHSKGFVALIPKKLEEWKCLGFAFATDGTQLEV